LELALKAQAHPRSREKPGLLDCQSQYMQGGNVQSRNLGSD